MYKALFVPSNEIDGVPFSGGESKYMMFDTEQEFDDFISANIKMPQKRELTFKANVNGKLQSAGIDHYVFEGDAMYYNDNAQSILIKSKATTWIGDDDCIMGNVIFYCKVA